MEYDQEQATTKYQAIEAACAQVKEYFKAYECSVTTANSDNEIFVRFPEDNGRIAFNFTVYRTEYNRQTRLKEHLEHIERRLRESGRI
ncbi:hypothetical protein [Edaphovirga cremea]|uniref:hypothetical protein n=1 Tax=Edaphovirga cremea TaxID=2267246 RepID=UPI0039892930